MFTDFELAAAIAYAVDNGAKVINLSLGGTRSSLTEVRALQYAAAKDVLVVAAAGNEAQRGNPVEYPAALLQPVGSNGVGGYGLAVGASTISGARAPPSRTTARTPSRHRARGSSARSRRTRRRSSGRASRSRARRRALRLQQRHVVRRAPGGRRRSARVGGQPVAECAPGRRHPEADRFRRGPVESRARIRRDERRGGRGTCAEHARRFAARVQVPGQRSAQLARVDAEGAGVPTPRHRPNGQESVLVRARSRRRRPSPGRPEGRRRSSSSRWTPPAR